MVNIEKSEQIHFLKFIVVAPIALGAIFLFIRTIRYRSIADIITLGV